MTLTLKKQIFLILGNQKRIQRLLDTMTSDNFSKDFDKFERIFTWYAWQGMYHHMRYQSFGTMAVFCWGFTPIADAISGHARRLPMEAWYPYDTKATPAFQLTCAHQSLAVILGCFHNISMDTLITGLINVACCQLEVVKRNLLELDVKTGSRESGEVKLREELHRCIQHSVDVMG
uniref:OR1_1 protein n=2 Tax=Fopius arisanus TaxID=64838 RepID=A0A0C9QZ39_9HYME